MRFPPTHCSSLYRSSLVGTVIALGSCLGITLYTVLPGYRTMSPIQLYGERSNLTSRSVSSCNCTSVESMTLSVSHRQSSEG